MDPEEFHSDTVKEESRSRVASPRRAIALRYRPDEGSAPRVTAKGSGELAERILAMARKHGIPIREDKELVQVLSHLDIDEEISPELYRVVAELLAFVYRTARDYRLEMAESYRRHGDQLRDEGNPEGARRSWKMAASIFQELGDNTSAASCFNRADG